MPSMPVLSCILIMLVSVSELYTRLAYIIPEYRDLSALRQDNSLYQTYA